MYSDCGDGGDGGGGGGGGDGTKFVLSFFYTRPQLVYGRGDTIMNTTDEVKMHVESSVLVCAETEVAVPPSGT